MTEHPRRWGPLGGLGWLLLLAFALRLAFGLSIGPRTIQPDEGVYVNFARSLHLHHVFGLEGVPSSGRPPALPFLLAGVFSIFGPSLAAARAFYALVGAAGVWFLYLLGSETFGRRTGALAAAFAAVYPFFVYWSGVLMTETLAIFFVVLALWRTQRLALEREAPRRGALEAGFLWSLATLTRTQNLVFTPLLAVWLWRRRGGRTGAGVGALFLAAGLALPAAWVARNRVVTGRATLDSHGGWTLLTCTMFYDENFIETSVAEQALERSDIYRQAMRLPPEQRDPFYMHEALRFIRLHPLRFLEGAGSKFVQLWRFYPRLDKVGAGPEFVGLKGRLFVLVSLCTEPLLIGLGLLGAAFCLRERRPVFPLLLFIVVTTLIHSVVISQMRYRLPMMPVVILFACYGALRLPGREEA